LNDESGVAHDAWRPGERGAFGADDDSGVSPLSVKHD